MNFLIVILLILIFVALISSNRDSADGVKKFLKFGALGLFFLLIWVVWATALWFTLQWDPSTQNDTEGWLFILGALAPILLPLLNFDAAKALIAKGWPRVMVETLKHLASACTFLLVAIFWIEVGKAGYKFDLVWLAFTLAGITLVGWSFAKNAVVYEVWFGPIDPGYLTDVIDTKLEEHTFTEDEIMRGGDREHRRRHLYRLSHTRSQDKVLPNPSTARSIFWSVPLFLLGDYVISEWTFTQGLLMRFYFFKAHPWLSHFALGVFILFAAAVIFHHIDLVLEQLKKPIAERIAQKMLSDSLGGDPPNFG